MTKLIVAKSIIGHEFMYSAKSAHSVSNNSAKKICSILNKYKYQLNDNEIWFIHEYDPFTNAGSYANYQSFTIRNGIVKERKC